MTNKSRNTLNAGVYACIMAGGMGKRFWPKSRARIPKQFHDIVNENTLFQDTVKRTLRICDINKTYVVTGSKVVDIVKKQAPKIPASNILIEPVSKNTLAAIAFCAFHIRCSSKDPNAIMLVLPSDHLIQNENKFENIIRTAIQTAYSDKLVLIGIKPSYASTGYGYIQSAGVCEGSNKKNVFNVKQFIEKPPKKRAEYMYRRDNYFWNGGMFCWKADVILEEIRRYAPRTYEVFDKYYKSVKNYSCSKNKKPVNIPSSVYKKLESISVDYAVLEKSKRLAVVRGDFKWEDLGAWTSLSKVMGKKDLSGNMLKGGCKLLDTRDCIIISDKNHLMGAIGVSDLVIIHTPDATLVAHKDKAQDVKKLVEKIEKDKNLKKYV